MACTTQAFFSPLSFSMEPGTTLGGFLIQSYHVDTLLSVVYCYQTSSFTISHWWPLILKLAQPVQPRFFLLKIDFILRVTTDT